MSANSSGVEVGSGLDVGDSRRADNKKLNKLLLAGCDQSGTSTMFKQVMYRWDDSLKKKTLIYLSLDSQLAVNLTESMHNA